MGPNVSFLLQNLPLSELPATSQEHVLLWFNVAMRHILFKPCLVLAALKWFKLHHSSRLESITPQTGNRTQNHSRSASDWQGGQEEIELTPPHACLGKAATYQFCSSYSPPSCPAGFPFSCAHDFGPPGTEFVLWKQNKAKRNPNMDQLRFMIISHFLAGTCYGSGLQITQIPRSPQLQAGAAVPHSSVLQCYSKNSLLCPFSPTISSTCTLSKLSFCSAAFLQMVSLIFQICSMLHLSLKATLLSHALTPLLFKT